MLKFEKKLPFGNSFPVKEVGRPEQSMARAVHENKHSPVRSMYACIPSFITTSLVLVGDPRDFSERAKTQRGRPGFQIVYTRAAAVVTTPFVKGVLSCDPCFAATRRRGGSLRPHANVGYSTELTFNLKTVPPGAAEI